MSRLPNTFVTPEEYLERERKAESKSEYYRGEVFAMSGGSRKHDRIVVRSIFLLAQHLQGKKCELFSAGMRVLVDPGGLYTYPDLSVACDPPRFTDERVDTLTNPTLLIEILSPSTESYDRGQKARLYRAAPSLRELLLISQTTYDVELYRRQENGHWALYEASGLDSAIEIASIGYRLQLRELYATVIEASEAGQT